MVARALLTFVLSVMLVGFGLCGVYGAFGGLSMAVGSREGRPFALLFLTSGAIGLTIAWFCGKSVADLWRKKKVPPSEQ